MQVEPDSQILVIAGEKLPDILSHLPEGLAGLFPGLRNHSPMVRPCFWASRLTSLASSLIFCPTSCVPSLIAFPVSCPFS